MENKEKAKKAWADILVKAWTDELFKQRLLTNCKKVLAEYGFPIDEKTNYEVHEDSKNTMHFTIPTPPEGNLSEEELRKIAGGVTTLQSPGSSSGGLLG